MSRLDGKVARIRGSTTGIGLATAQLLMAEGAKVASFVLDEELVIDGIGLS